MLKVAPNTLDHDGVQENIQITYVLDQLTDATGPETISTIDPFAFVRERLNEADQFLQELEADLLTDKFHNSTSYLSMHQLIDPLIKRIKKSIEETQWKIKPITRHVSKAEMAAYPDNAKDVYEVSLMINNAQEATTECKEAFGLLDELRSPILSFEAVKGEIDKLIGEIDVTKKRIIVLKARIRTYELQETEKNQKQIKRKTKKREQPKIKTHEANAWREELGNRKTELAEMETSCESTFEDWETALYKTHDLLAEFAESGNTDINKLKSLLENHRISWGKTCPSKKQIQEILSKNSEPRKFAVYNEEVAEQLKPKTNGGNETFFIGKSVIEKIKSPEELRKLHIEFLLRSVSELALMLGTNKDNSISVKNKIIAEELMEMTKNMDQFEEDGSAEGIIVIDFEIPTGSPVIQSTMGASIKIEIRCALDKPYIHIEQTDSIYFVDENGEMESQLNNGELIRRTLFTNRSKRIITPPRAAAFMTTSMPIVDKLKNVLSNCSFKEAYVSIRSMAGGKKGKVLIPVC